MCTKQETHDILDRFYLFIERITWNYVNLEENPEFSPSHWWTWNNWNIKKTTGLLIWSKTIGTQAHAHTYIHRNTKLLGKKDKNYTFCTFRTFLLYVLIFYKLKLHAKSPKTHLLRDQTPPKWQLLEEAPGVHHRRRPLDLTEMTQNK